MKRFRPLLILTCSLTLGYVALLCWSGRSFYQYLVRQERPSPIVAPAPLQVTTGEQATLELKKLDPTRETRISLFLDVANPDAQIGNFPVEGVIHDLALFEDTLLVASDGSGLGLIDVSVPKRPRMIESILHSYSILDIEQQGDRVYLSCGRQGLLIYEFSAAGQLGRKETVHVPGVITSARVHQGYLFATVGRDGWLIYSLMNDLINSPIYQQSLGEIVYSIDFFADLAIMRTRSRMLAYDIDDPSHPELAWTLVSSADLGGSAVVGGRLLVSDHSGQLRAYLLPEKGIPQLQETHSFPSSLGEIRVSGEQLLLEQGNSELAILGLDDLSADAEGAHIYMERPNTLIGVGDILYIGSNPGGLNLIDRTALRPRQSVEEIATDGKVNDLLVSEDWMYIADQEAGLLARHLPSGMMAEVRISAGPVAGLAKSGTLLYLARGNQGIAMVDVKDPWHPVELGKMTETVSLSTAAQGSYLVSASGTRLTLLDWQPGRVPTILDQVEQTATDLVLDKSYVYLASRTDGLKIYRISQDHQLEVEGQLNIPWPMSTFNTPVRLAIRDKTIYLASGESGLQVVNVENPQSPEILSLLDLPGFATAIHLEGDSAYVSSRFRGIHVVDISRPDRPVLLASVPSGSFGRRVAVKQDQLYLPMGTRGVMVMPAPTILSDIRKISPQAWEIDLPPGLAVGRYSLQVNRGQESRTFNGLVSYH